MTCRFAASSVTSAPRSRAASASATPIRPEERFPRNRTASSGSRVPPAVTSTRRPASEPFRCVGVGARARSTTAATSSGSDIRPAPTSPSASSPKPGPTTVAPRSTSSARLACVAACSHIAVFIAGARTSGPRWASAVSVRRSSASPCARRAIVWAVSGATTSRSASARCGYGSAGGSLRASAQNVRAATNSSAPRVTTGVTSWPARTSSRTSSHAL